MKVLIHLNPYNAIINITLFCLLCTVCSLPIVIAQMEHLVRSHRSKSHADEGSVSVAVCFAYALKTYTYVVNKKASDAADSTVIVGDAAGCQVPANWHLAGNWRLAK